MDGTWEKAARGTGVGDKGSGEQEGMWEGEWGRGKTRCLCKTGAEEAEQNKNMLSG